MKQIRIRLCLRLWCVSILVLLVATPTLGVGRPNVILIVTDDQGYGDMACHGNPWLQTPNLDRLYAESVRLEDYHVDPVCTPTRASLMTGRYSSRVGAWTVTQGRQLLRPGEVTMAELFSDSDYRYPHFAVLTERWRLVDGELFNIVDDPRQKRNVASEHANIVRDLRVRYEQHFADVFSDNAAYTRFQLGASEENPTFLTVRDWHPTEGNVTWRQEQLSDDTLAINGFWAVNVVRAGHYSIRLSRFPDDAPQPMRAIKARLRVGMQELERKLEGNEASVTFELDLPKDHGLLQSWLSDEEGGVRGAYFVQVKRVHE